jgi:uncharacterized protein (TIGR03435 family)
MERFGLHAHDEQREVPVYVLIQGKSPLKLKESTPESLRREEKPTLMRVGRNRIEANRCTVEQLASFLGPLRGRPILDRTKLSGKYDFSLEFSRETGTVGGEEDNGPASIFTAVQEQLGLRLVPAKAPQWVVVVDEVSRPTAN